jgi:hypothetical protein
MFERPTSDEMNLFDPPSAQKAHGRPRSSS